jgi:hypothetical protein
MAHLKNDLGLHASPALIAAATASIQPPSPEVFRVTSIIDSPLIRTLTIEHWDDLEISLSKSISALHGTAWHLLMEKYCPATSVAEETLEIEVPGYGKFIIRGTPDEYTIECDINDHKTCKVWKYINGDFTSFEEQLNTYSLMLQVNGKKVRNLNVYAAFTDWSKYKKLSGGDSYPKERALLIPQRHWEREEQVLFLQNRIKDHIENPMRPCTKKEMWEEDTTYALKKKGRKSAVKVENSTEDINIWASEKGLDISKPEFSIETRPGRRIRCEDWCGVAEFCPYFKESSND